MSENTEAVVSAVAAHIRENDLRSGDPLPSEGAVAASVGVSRTVVRQAFGALSALRLIEVGNGRRPRVGKVDGSIMASSFAHAINTAQATVPQVWDTRRALEKRTAELAAMQRTDAEAAAIVAAAASLREAGDDLAAQTEQDIQFHAAIAAATHNPIFVLLISSFADLMRRTCPVGWRSRRTDADRLAVFDQHDRIAEAIALGDPAGAETAMSAHFDLSLQALVNAGFN